MPTTVKPGEDAPRLEVETLDAGGWRLSEQRPDAFTMVVFYRGLHCPVCRGYLRDLARRLDDFSTRGVDVLAVTGDVRERAEQAQRDWELGDLPLGYGLPTDVMRKWGLFVSRGIADGEPDAFGEPGLFLVKPDGSVFYEAINSMPFGRPSFAEILGGVDFVTEQGHPARGAS